MTPSRKPTKYSAKQKKHIIGLTRKLLNEGMSLHKIAKRKDMPEARTLKAWLAEERKNEAAARGSTFHAMVERHLTEHLEPLAPLETDFCDENGNPLGSCDCKFCTGDKHHGCGACKTEPKPLSRSEKEKLCEEYEACSKQISGTRYDIELNFGGGLQAHTVSFSNPDVPSRIADEALRDRMAEIKTRVGQDYLDDYRERKALEKRVKELEDFADATVEVRKGQLRVNAMLWIMTFLLAAAVVVSHLALR